MAQKVTYDYYDVEVPTEIFDAGVDGADDLAMLLAEDMALEWVVPCLWRVVHAFRDVEYVEYRVCRESRRG